VAFQPHQHGLVGAVAATGQCQRAEDFSADARDVGEAAGFIQPAFDETC